MSSSSTVLHICDNYLFNLVSSTTLKLTTQTHVELKNNNPHGENEMSIILLIIEMLCSEFKQRAKYLIITFSCESAFSHFKQIFFIYGHLNVSPKSHDKYLRRSDNLEGPNQGQCRWKKRVTKFH